METNIEEWFDIPNFEGIYQVTRSGKIKKIGKKSKYKDLIYPDKMMKHNTHTNKYKYITFMVDGVKKYYSIHRLLASIFIANPENKPQVNHINGIKDDNRLENLEWVTLSGNMQHAAKNGLLKPKRGESNYGARLCEDDVRSIRRMSDVHGIPITHIAKMYDMGSTIIWMIVKRRKWASIG